MRNVYDTNGALLEQTILSTETIKEPVNKKVVEGTKKVTSSTKYITGSGQFIWPVPNYRYCSRWYGGRPQGRGHLRPGRYAHLRLRRRHRHQGGLQQGRCRYRLWLLGHHQPRRRIQLCVCTLPVPDRPARARPSSRASSSAIWAARAVPPATTATSRYVSMVRIFLPRVSSRGKNNLSVNASHCQPLPFRHFRATSPGRGSLS